MTDCSVVVLESDDEDNDEKYTKTIYVESDDEDDEKYTKTKSKKRKDDDPDYEVPAKKAKRAPKAEKAAKVQKSTAQKRKTAAPKSKSKKKKGEGESCEAQELAGNEEVKPFSLKSEEVDGQLAGPAVSSTKTDPVQKVQKSTAQKRKTAAPKSNSKKKKGEGESCEAQELAGNEEVKPFSLKSEEVDGQLAGPAVSSTKTDPELLKNFQEEWSIEDVVSQKLRVELRFIRNVIRLFREENTIPFIARYRREQTGDMDAEALRKAKDVYESLMAVKQRMASIAASISRLGAMTPDVEQALKCAQSTSELEHIYAPFKTPSARSLAEKARALGLEDAAIAVLEGTKTIDPMALVTEQTETLDKVVQGMQHIVADAISKKQPVLDLMRRQCGRDSHLLTMFSKEVAVRVKTEGKAQAKTEAKAQAKTEGKAPGKAPAKAPDKKAAQARDNNTFANYYNFSCSIRYLKPHQVLAIFRGESLKILSVKIEVSDSLRFQLQHLCQQQFFCKGVQYEFRGKLLRESLDDAYKRLLVPLVVRHVRSELLAEAQEAAVDVFARNLKQLLLTPPLRGQPIMAIDPGFKHGCKVAIIDGDGTVLRTAVIHLHMPGALQQAEMARVRELLSETGCSLIALGNGHGCRETEQCLSRFIKQGFFRPLDVQYTIVSEQGVSIYSCSPIASEEFPHLEPNLISAVSLARRLQDPLSELVKVAPKHIGVGMYQHDVPEKKLSTALDEVVSECVSFVGVDVNTASLVLLKHVAGLNAARASNIIAWRTDHGPFTNRDQLHQVKGVGPKTFEQCAGFLRVLPKTSTCSAEGSKKTTSKAKGKAPAVTAPNPLDQTWIHPEAYVTVFQFLELCELSLDSFGSKPFNNKLQQFVRLQGEQRVADQLGVSTEQLSFFMEGLLRPTDVDFRAQFQKPLFRRSVLSLMDVKPDDVLTGRVGNVTHFGAFVDVGVGRDGLIHNSNMKGQKLQVGDRVEVVIVSVSVQTNKLSLRLLRVL